MSEPGVQKNIALEIQFFGSFSLRIQGRAPHLRARAEQYVLLLLALRRDEAIERKWLAVTLWPDSTEDKALFNLRRNLTDLRRALASEAHRLSSPAPRTLRFDFSDTVCDLIAFDHAFESQDESALESAVALYHGPLLAECDAPWIQADRTLREERCLSALERLASQTAQRGDYADTVVYLRQAVAQDPTRESAVCALMEALAAKHDYSAVTQTYRQFRSFLHDELQMEPSAGTAALFQRLLAAGRHHDISPAPVRTSEGEISVNRTSHSGRRTSVRLPCPLTTLVGRETERREIAECLGVCRLVTLTGAGGVGKTRLAIAVAEDVAAEYEDGVRFVSFADISDPLLVPQAVAAVLHLHAEAGRPFTETIRDYLECRSLLLVLDNCEHLLTHCAALVEALLDGCPSLRILATSRVSLGLIGETLWRVPSLSLPAPSRIASDSRNAGLPETRHSDAVQLFVERAQAAERGFTLTNQNSQAVAQVCRMLDGIPFAIELASAWVRTLSVEQVAARLQDRLLPLANSNRIASPRQQTLRAMLDWSYGLLDNCEMDLLRRLAVFTGGWTLEAVEAICLSAEGSQADLVAVLAQLVDKSLVVVYAGPDGGIYYRLLETTREYAREQWNPDLQENLRRRHAIYYRRLVGQAVHELSTKTSISSQTNVRAQIDNVREARLWWQALDPDAAQEFTLELVQCGGVAYHSQEIRDWITHLDRSDTLVPSPFHTALYLYMGRCAEWLGDVATGCRLWEKGLAMAMHRGDQPRIAQAHRFLAFAATRQQEYAQAHRHYEASLANMQETESSAWTIEEVRIEYGQMALQQGDLSAAKRRFEHSLERGRQCDDWRIVEDALDALGCWAEAREEYTLAQSYWEERLQLLRRQAWEGHMPRTLTRLAAAVAHSGDFDTAWLYLEEALTLCSAESPDPSRGWIQFSMAQMALKQGRYAVANASLAQSLAIFLELNEYGSLGHCLRGMVEFEVAQQRFEGAACLLGNAAAMAERYRWPIPSAERTKLDRLQSDLQNILEAAVFQQAWARGAAMTLMQAVAFAEHSLANPLPFANPGKPTSLRPPP
jgi:predicted ATPase/DNA-binding SARP family transcriptional activator